MNQELWGVGFGVFGFLVVFFSPGVVRIKHLKKNLCVPPSTSVALIKCSVITELTLASFFLEV